MGKENAGANQAQNCCDRFIHRKCPLRPLLGQNDHRFAQSKGILTETEIRI
jgi:hypothetical protein